MPSYLISSDGTRHLVTHGLTLGRVSGCDVVLDDAKVSRQHARLQVERGIVEVQDLGSSNGTSVNGRRIDRVMLRHADLLRCGNSELRYEEGTEATQPLVMPDAEVTEGSEASEESGELEIIEFVDEVVEVRRKPDVEPSSVSLDETQAVPDVAERGRSVLQFAKTKRAGLLGQDASQLGGLPRTALWLGLIVLVIALGALGYWVVR